MIIVRQNQLYESCSSKEIRNSVRMRREVLKSIPNINAKRRLTSLEKGRIVLQIVGGQKVSL